MARLDVPQKKKTCDQMVKGLSPEQIEEINEYLTSVGEYGEIRLIVQNGELRYINTVASHKAMMTKHSQRKEIYKT